MNGNNDNNGNNRSNSNKGLNKIDNLLEKYNKGNELTLEELKTLEDFSKNKRSELYAKSPLKPSPLHGRERAAALLKMLGLPHRKKNIKRRNTRKLRNKTKKNISNLT